MNADELKVGEHIRTADWDYGIVEAVRSVQHPQTMYNLTVDEAHTFFVGGGQWLVHNVDCGRVSLDEIRASQSSYNPVGDIKDEFGNVTGQYSVDENAQWLIDHPGEDLPWGDPIKVFRKDASMDSWETALAPTGEIGDAKNLLDGEIYSLDHRRLAAYQLAGREDIPVQWLDLSDPDDYDTIFNQRYKFTTQNWGDWMYPSNTVPPGWEMGN